MKSWLSLTKDTNAIPFYLFNVYPKLCGLHLMSILCVLCRYTLSLTLRAYYIDVDYIDNYEDQ
jgi:hypothetical protein